MPTLADSIQIHKALAHPARLRVLAMLRTGELCSCQVAAVLGLAPSTVSAHMAELRRAGLIDERRETRWVHYRLAESTLQTELLALLWPSLLVDPEVRADAAVLRRLRAVDVAELCRLDLDLAKLGIPRPVLRAAGGRA